MLLEVSPKTCNKDGNVKGEKDLTILMSSLNTLSINEPPSKEVTQLEYEIAKVSLCDNKDADKAEVKTAKEEVAQAAEEHVTTDDKKESESEEKKLNNSDKINQLEIKEETEKGEKQKVCDEKDISGKISSQDVEKDNKVVTESRKDKEEPKDEKKQESPEKEVSDSENESSSDETAPDESAPVVKEKKEKKLLRRGFGAGTQNDQHYTYPMYHSDYGNYQCEPPAVAPVSYATQLTMSPQQAMSPGYSNMPVSPVPGYTEPMYMQNGDGYFDNTMSSFLGSPGMGVDPYWIPDTPPSPVRDDTDLQGLAPTESSLCGHSPGDVLEAISKVEREPMGSVASENLLPIIDDLFAELENIPVTTSSGLIGSNIDSLVDSELNSNPQACSVDYPNILSPPAEDDLSDRIAEREIQSRLDETQYTKAIRRMALITNEALTEKDSEGDNPCVVVACQDENSPRYYENLVAMVERARAIDICCEKPVSRENRCVVCGNTNQLTFYSPFAMRNNEGDTLLSSVIRAQQPELVINYICENIYPRQADIRIIFGGQNADFYRYLMSRYPILSVFLNSGF